MDKSLLHEIRQLKLSETPAALVTIIGTKGSTPRKAGTKMLIGADGRITGTIGGGCAEAEVKLKALQVIGQKAPMYYKVTMLADAAEEEGMVCGGTMDVFIQPL